MSQTQKLGIHPHVVRVTSERFASDFGASRNQFHHHWCNPLRIGQSYVKETLQEPPNVLPSGPFNKSFPASHGPKFIPALRFKSRGQIQR